MRKAVAEWTKDDVLALPAGENDSFERKGSLMLDLSLPQVKEGHVLDELAKQLSAFANTGGGQVIYGITDAGLVDNGGIARSIKGRQSTKEWLEDVIPNLTEFEIVGFNVYEIQAMASSSPFAAEKSIYVIDVPDSERAPHQSKRDRKYYVRLGGKSVPASHRLIEDIRNRAKHPTLEVYGLEILRAEIAAGTEKIVGLIARGPIRLTIALGVRNLGMVRASGACSRIDGEIPFTPVTVHNHEAFFRSAAQGTVLIELNNPLYPGMGVTLTFDITTPAEVEADNVGAALTLSTLDAENVLLANTIFADSAPARRQQFRLGGMDPQRHLTKAMYEAVKRIRADRDRTVPRFFDPSS